MLLHFQLCESAIKGISLRNKTKTAYRHRYSCSNKSKKRLVILCLLFTIIAFYSYFWFWADHQEKLEIVEPEVSFEPWEPEDIHSSEAYEEDVVDTDLIVAQILDKSPADLCVEHFPDIRDVLHISEILKLKQKADSELSADQQNFSKQEALPIRIAVVIDDMGASPLRTKEIIALKAPLTSSFVTFAPQLKKQTEQARQSGHELMIHVPMQPKSKIFVSDDVLTVDMTQQQIKERFSKMLDKFDHVVGVNNHMGSLYTEYGDKLAPIMKLLADHHLFFLDSKTTPFSKGEKIAEQYNVPSVHRHVFLDNENNLEYILRQLEKAEDIARKNGYAIAIGHPKTQTSKALEAWLKTLPQKEIKLVHLSQIVEDEATQH